MESEEFRKFGKAVVDYAADYLDNIRNRPVVSSVTPGYLQNLLPPTAPLKGHHWTTILQDIDRTIMPGLTHWHSPNFHAFYPTANSHPGIVGELLLSGLGVVSTDEFTDNVCLDLERRMLDWLAKMLNLPSHFLNSDAGPGGGLIQNAASESTLLALLVAKSRFQSGTNLVAYTSEESNSSVEKAGLMASVTMRLLPTDLEGGLRGCTLLRAIEDDVRAGFTPCCVVATLGTTGTCAFDCLGEIGPICQKFGLWLHVDAAYAGAAFVCPEYRYFMEGIDYVDSFCTNPHKWMLVNSDCSAMWFKNMAAAQFWQIPETRRFRALKLWFVLRIYGVEGVRAHIRKQIGLARYFRELVESDGRFEVCRASMGVVCFRAKGADALTRKLLDGVATGKRIFVMPYRFHGRLLVRFVICSRFTEEEDVLYAWREILSQMPAIIYADC